MTLSFIAGTIFYLIHPSLAENKTAMLSLTLGIFWVCTFTNFFGLQISSAISTVTAILGNIVPMAMILLLAAVWLMQGNTPHIPLTFKAAVPKFTDLQTLVFFAAMVFGFLGLEMSAIHAEDVRNPQRDYPRALFFSTIFITATLTLSALAVAIVVPQENISIVTGLIQAFDGFLTTFQLHGWMPWMALFIILGGLGAVAAWILSPTRALLVALQENNAPAWILRTNRHQAPVALLMLQALVFTLLCSAFLLMPNVSSSYWIISAMATQTALLVYIPMFAALVKLRRSHPHVPRSFKIPGGTFGLWLTAVVGIVTVSFAAFLCFIPPSQIDIGDAHRYTALLLGGNLLFCLGPVFLYWYLRRLQHGRNRIHDAASRHASTRF